MKFKKFIPFVLASMVLGGAIPSSTIFAEDRANAQEDLSPVIESVQMLKGNEDLFNKEESLFTSGTLQVKLNYDTENTDLKINNGDTLSVNLVPVENDKSFLSMDYTTSLLRLLEDNGVKIADLDLTTRHGVDFTFTDIVTSFQAELNMPFEVNETHLIDYFEMHPTENTFSFQYKLQYDGKDTGKVLNFTLNKPETSPASTNFEKTSGLYIQGAELGQGDMFYNIRMGTTLRQSNELSIYDTPDINLGFDGDMRMAIPSKFGGVNNLVVGKNQNYYIESGDISDEDKMEIFLYDIYFLTEDKGASAPRQAAYEEKKIMLERTDTMTGADTLESMDTVSVPKNILVEKMSGEPLTEAEQKIIDDNGGLYKTVGKGFKIRIKNFKSKEYAAGGFLTLAYSMNIKNNSPVLNGYGYPVYTNSASRYVQEIPSCKPEDATCSPVNSEKTNLNQIIPTKGEVTPGNVGADVDKYSKVDFIKVQSDMNGLPDMDKPLSGAVFNIYKIAANGSKTIAVNKDGLDMETLITNADGQLCINNQEKTLVNLRLERGNYIFEEVSAPENFDIQQKETNVVVGLLENNVIISNSSKAVQLFEVTYRFESTDKEKNLPQSVLDLLPEKQININDGTEVIPGQVSENVIKTEDGVWTFKGWNKSKLTIDGANDEFVGLWEFKKEQIYQIDTEVVNGSISESITDIKKGENKEISYSPKDGYILESITVDGKNVDVTKFESAYIFENVNGDHTIKVVYKAQDIETPVTPETPNTPNNKPDQPNSGNTQKPSQSSDSVQTGDTTNRMLYIGGLIASLSAVIGICLFIRKKKSTRLSHFKKNP